MADFLTAYKKYVEPWEGGFANISGDKGGKTYAGITEINFPNWSGWQYINNILETRVIKNNEKFPVLNDAVISLYKSLWDKNNFGLIKSQEIANILFDFYVNSGNSAIKAVQRLIGVSTDGSLGKITAEAINKRNAATLHDMIKQTRIDFYNNIVKRDASQAKFLSGWMKRINSFPTLAKATGGAVILILCLFFIYLLINK